MADNKIVIVDDEVDMAQLLQIELETEGYEVAMVHDGQSGLELIRNLNPSLVILDVMMPDMTGYEVLKSLKEDPSTRDIPVIMLTAKGLEDDIQKGLDLGADDYISKPFHSGLLIKRIQTALRR